MPLTIPSSLDPIALTVAVPASSVEDRSGNENAMFSEVIDVTPLDSTATPPAGTTLIFSHNASYGNLDWLNSVVSRTPAGGGFMGISDLTKIGNYLYGVTQIMHRSDTTATRLSSTMEAGAAIFRINLSNNQNAIVKAYTHYTQAARSLAEFRNEAYWFEGSAYNYVFGEGHSADAKIGNVFSQTASGCVKSHGVNFRSQLGRVERSGDFNNDYGVHGGTLSPMRTRNNVMNLVSGYGNFQLMQDGEDPAADIDNWQLLQFAQNVPLRLPLLETNGRTGWEIVTEIARITNSIVGFQQGRILFKPRSSLTATLDGRINSSATTLNFEQGERPLPTRGLILIDNKLIEYVFTVL